MSTREKFVAQLLSGTADAHISFEALCHLLTGLGFTERVRAVTTFFTGPESLKLLTCKSVLTEKPNCIRSSKYACF